MSNEKEKTAFLQAPIIPRKTGAGGNADAVLVSIYPSGTTMGKRFALNKQEHFVGRLEELEIPLEGEGLSRRHARIFRDAHGWYIEDLGSTNGTHVNDVKIARQQLADGDLIRTGVAICKFLAGDNIEAAYHEEIYRMSIMDGLTGVHNKRYFLELMERELATSVRQQTPLSLIMMDIDHFKKINDTHGHLVGDEVLREFATRLNNCRRQDDLLCRYGGEEFVLILSETPLTAAIQLAERCRLAVAQESFSTSESSIDVTVSIGAASLNLEHQRITRATLLELADQQLYLAKKSGRNRVMHPTALL